ncbi:MAG TPA: putative Ig domain-containing protein [Candidatus Lumbricidophila sp.]|nr:putative Ig domain-containing protein [Candidatus Lumbricidophila sp.]
MPKRRLRRAALASVCTATVAVGLFAAGAPAANAVIADGAQQTLVVLTKFPSEQWTGGVSTHITVDQARANVFDGADSANAMFKEMSGGRVSLAGVVAPAIVDMTDAAAGCKTGELVRQARAGAQAQGIDVSKYPRTIVYTSKGAGCNGGIGTSGTGVGGYVQMDWYMGGASMVHEIGHNFGLSHSGLMRCKDSAGNEVPLYQSGYDAPNGEPSSCGSDVYGDPYDPMGAGDLRSWFSAPHLYQLGWLSSAQATTVTENGVYTLNALEDNGAGRRALRLPINPNGAEIWIEHRASLPQNRFDQFGTDQVTQGVSLRLSTNASGMTRLLNMNPTGAHNSQLNVGQSWTYPGVATVKLLSIDAATNTAQVQITKDPMITTDKTLPDAVAGSAYSTQLTERGGTPAFGWSIDSGALPAGMTLSTDGVISGTPTTPGTYQVKVRLRDAAAQKDWRLFTITVKAPVGFVTAKALPGATAGTAYSTKIEAAGGSGSYSWWLADGALPAGLSLTGATSTSINVTGTPTTPGTYTFKLRVNDNGTYAYRTFTIVVS